MLRDTWNRQVQAEKISPAWITRRELLQTAAHMLARSDVPRNKELLPPHQYIGVVALPFMA